MDERNSNAWLFTGILAGVLIGPVLMLSIWFVTTSQRPSTGRLVIEQQQASRKQAQEKNLDGNSIPEAQAEMDRGDLSAQRQTHEGAPTQDRWGTVPDWIVAIAAIVALLIYRAQTGHMSQANKASDAIIQQMRLEQRAWLSITANASRLEVGAPLGIDFVFTNSGLTPALIHKVKIGSGIQTDYRLVDYDQIAVNHKNQPWQHRENTVAPSGSYVVPLVNGHVVTAHEAESLHRDRNGVLYVLITVQYSDFKDGRESQVLLTYSLGTEKFEQWERHNYMT